MIYLETVAPSASLSSIVAATMVKITVPPEILKPIDYLHDSPSGLGKPLFETLVPYGVHLAISVYDDRKDEFVRSELSSRLVELEALQSSYDHLLFLYDAHLIDASYRSLRSLNLPGSIQALEAPVGLPSSLLKKADEVRIESGPARIRSMINDVSTLARSSRSILNEANQILTHANTVENISQLGNSFQSLIEKAREFTSTLDRAGQSDDTVKIKFREWEDNIVLLTSSAVSTLLLLFAILFIFNLRLRMISRKPYHRLKSRIYTDQSGTLILNRPKSCASSEGKWKILLKSFRKRNV